MYAKYIKRILDFTLSLLALIVLSPLMLIIYILVRIKLGKPAIFKQKRPGKDEKIFNSTVDFPIGIAIRVSNYKGC